MLNKGTYNITGGSVNGAIIGNTTPNEGSFSHLNAVKANVNILQAKGIVTDELIVKSNIKVIDYVIIENRDILCENIYLKSVINRVCATIEGVTFTSTNKQLGSIFYISYYSFLGYVNNNVITILAGIIPVIKNEMIDIVNIQTIKYNNKVKNVIIKDKTTIIPYGKRIYIDGSEELYLGPYTHKFLYNVGNTNVNIKDINVVLEPGQKMEVLWHGKWIYYI